MLINKQAVKRYIKDKTNVYVEKDFYSFLERRVAETLNHAIRINGNKRKLTQWELGRVL